MTETRKLSASEAGALAVKKYARTLKRLAVHEAAEPFTPAGWLDRSGNRMPWDHPVSLAGGSPTSRRDVVLGAWDELPSDLQRWIVTWLT